MASSLPWIRAATPPALGDKELHVWRASLDRPTDMLPRAEGILSTDEKERARKFLMERAREHFVAARGILRQLLAMYVGTDPHKVEMRYGPQGKPSLAGSHNSKICFNVSHSQEMALFAFATGGEIGVDIEEVKPDFKGIQIAAHFFSEDEITQLAELPPKQAQEAFFGCWTRKEAYVKARGNGLSIPLSSFTVSFTDKEQILRGEGEEVWTCYALEPAEGYAGAVVAPGEQWSLRYYEWSGTKIEALISK